VGAVGHYGLQAAVGIALALTAVPQSRLAAQQAGRIPYDTYTLPNALQVVLSEDHSTPIVTVNLWYRVGAANEVPGRSGFAHLFEHMMFQGSANVRKAEHFQLVERSGGGLNASTNWDFTNYYETVPSNRLNLALWLEADRMRSLAVNQENLDNQRQAVQEELRLRIDNQPYARAIWEGFSQPFDSTGCFAYGHLLAGSMQDLDSARVEDVQAFFRQYYAPNNATLVLAGDFDPGEARQLIEQFFGGVPRQSDALPTRCEFRFGSVGRRVERTDRNANIPAVSFFFPSPPRSDPDAPAFDLVTSILYDGESSRLNRRLVRAERAALAVQGFGFQRRGPGVVFSLAVANAGVPTGRIEELMAEEVAKLWADSIPHAELVKAQNQARAAAIRDRQTTFGKAEALQAALYIDGHLESVNTEMERYLRVSTADLRRVAQRYLAPENRLTVIVNPPAGGN
jgi:predicted Zn-dependent peptidase